MYFCYLQSRIKLINSTLLQTLTKHIRFFFVVVPMQIYFVNLCCYPCIGRVTLHLRTRFCCAAPYHSIRSAFKKSLY